MMGYILLTLSGNGFKAQFKHLTAACFNKSREWTEGVGDAVPGIATLVWMHLLGAGEHCSVTGTLSGSPKENGVEAVLLSPPLPFWDISIHIKSGYSSDSKVLTI